MNPGPRPKTTLKRVRRQTKRDQRHLQRVVESLDIGHVDILYT